MQAVSHGGESRNACVFEFGNRCSQLLESGYGFRDTGTIQKGLDADLEFLQQYADLGYVIFATDYQGEGSNHTVPRDLLGAEVYDVIALLNIAQRRTYVDKNRIYLWGTSRGSAVALLTLDRLGLIGRGDDIKAAAIETTIYDIDLAASEQFSELNPLALKGPPGHSFRFQILNPFFNLKILLD